MHRLNEFGVHFKQKQEILVRLNFFAIDWVNFLPFGVVEFIASSLYEGGFLNSFYVDRQGSALSLLDLMPTSWRA